MTTSRKINLGEDYCIFTGKNAVEGDAVCDHDYPAESQVDCDEGEGSHWTCSKCGNVRCYEVWQ